MLLLQPLQPALTEPPFTISDGVNLFWNTVQEFIKGIIERLPYLIVGGLIFLLAKGVKRVVNRVARRSHDSDLPTEVLPTNALDEKYMDGPDEPGENVRMKHPNRNADGKADLDKPSYS